MRLNLPSALHSSTSAVRSDVVPPVPPVDPDDAVVAAVEPDDAVVAAVVPAVVAAVAAVVLAASSASSLPHDAAMNPTATVKARALKCLLCNTNLPFVVGQANLSSRREVALRQPDL